MSSGPDLVELLGLGRQLGAAVAAGEHQAKAVPPPPLSGGRAMLRKAVQALNRSYWV